MKCEISYSYDGPVQVASCKTCGLVWYVNDAKEPTCLAQKMAVQVVRDTHEAAFAKITRRYAALELAAVVLAVLCFVSIFAACAVK